MLNREVCQMWDILTACSIRAGAYDSESYESYESYATKGVGIRRRGMDMGIVSLWVMI